MTTIELAGLTARIAGDPPTSRESPLVILLHGYGAPGDDLISLADEITAPQGTRFLFPHGPIDLESTMGPGSGARAWWPIDMVRMQVALMTGQLDALANELLPGLQASIGPITSFVRAASERFELPTSRIVLGGFSQGAILSLAAALENAWELGGLLLFSPTLVDSNSVNARARAKQQACVLSHGQVDPILPFTSSQRLHSLLVECGWHVDWVPFMGGHGIPPAALAAAGRLIARAFP
ncbi:MAG TPA: hypothetical protein VIV60_12775 [Polyangiaceae bacterium]